MASDSAWGCRQTRFSFPLTRTLLSGCDMQNPPQTASPTESAALRLPSGVGSAACVRAAVPCMRNSLLSRAFCGEEEERRDQPVQSSRFPGVWVPPGACPSETRVTVLWGDPAGPWGFWEERAAQGRPASAVPGPACPRAPTPGCPAAACLLGRRVPRRPCMVDAVQRTATCGTPFCLRLWRKGEEPPSEGQK